MGGLNRNHVIITHFCKFFYLSRRRRILNFATFQLCHVNNARAHTREIEKKSGDIIIGPAEIHVIAIYIYFCERLWEFIKK